MRRLLCLAVLSCTAFAATPALAETHSRDTDRRVFVIIVGDKGTVLSCRQRSPKPACVALERAGGDPARLPSRTDAVCTMEYNPVRVSALGVWGGRPVRYERTFSNSCQMQAAMGPLSQF
ncbi:serine protease [Nonomuraea rhodomycinica]|uniref:Serine protease n=1 Tax=Nonomuraea rhodomycinica TaxID=1712872 RepID=A0A7Y6ME14_9ACTN|nr:serine protease [Nonomuraea rhodomycinica]